MTTSTDVGPAVALVTAILDEHKGGARTRIVIPRLTEESASLLIGYLAGVLAGTLIELCAERGTDPQETWADFALQNARRSA